MHQPLDDKPSDQQMCSVATAAAVSALTVFSDPGPATTVLLAAALNVARNHGISDAEVIDCLRGLIADNPLIEGPLQ